MAAGAPCGRMYLIDAHSLIFQVFHAIPEMSSPSGLPTNALFGFTKDVLSLRDLKPDYLIACFDVAGPTFRDKIYPEYKAHRAPMPNDLSLQIPLIYEMLDAMHVPVVGVEGFEADDVIATIATAAAQREYEVLVCTSDKDCRQLIDDHVKLFNLRKNKVLDRSGLQEDWAVTPEQVVDLQALVGDSVDNVPGVPGIGLKTGAKLLQEFGTLDNILANVAKIPGKKQESLREFGEKVLISRQLVQLDRNVAIDHDWDGWKLRDWDAERLLDLFVGWGFHRFADQVRSSRRNAPVPVASGDRPVKLKQGSLFADDDTVVPNGKPAPPRRENWQGTYHLIHTSEQFEDVLKTLRQQKRIAVDLKTASLSPRQADIVGISFAWKEGEGWYLALRAPEGEPMLDAKATLDALRCVLENDDVEKIAENSMDVRIVFRHHGIALAGLRGDPMVADYLLHAGERSHRLDDLANRYLDHTLTPLEDLVGKGKKQVCLDAVPAAKVADYAGEDADVAWRLDALLAPRLREEKLEKLYGELEIPLTEVLAELEFNGIRLNIPLLDRLGKEMASQLADIEKDIYRLAGREFNIASPKQLREVLFNELKLPAQRRTGVTRDASTDQETLDRLAALGYELPVKIVEHRQIAKLKGTYVDALPQLVNPSTGRVHASFNQTVAATGRLSSSDPNLQNVPVRTEQGRQIRQAFVPEPGWVLLTADYSQIELRLLAHFSGDEHLRAAFVEDRDIHAAVASQIYGVAEDLVSSEMRRNAKTVNFGVIYGISAMGLGQRLGMTREEAAKFIDQYFARYPKVAEYQQKLLLNCYKTQYVGTILGRRRQITGVRSRTTYQQRNQPEREAINMEIQGSAADLIKQAMLNIYRRLKKENREARMLLQIHDELVFEVPPAELTAVAKLVNEEMTAALPLEVPVKVDISAGGNWLEVEEVK
jgi:DNA polymerase-1